jgi:hypothetical protein
MPCSDAFELPSASATGRRVSRQSRMNEIRHLKSHSVRIELREVTAHLQEMGRWRRQVYGEPDTDGVMQPVAYHNYLVLLVISMIDGKG